MDSTHKCDFKALSDEEWRQKLTPEQYKVCRQRGTELPFTGVYNDHKESGTYVCSICESVLFKSDHKFDSGTGWPSFHTALDGNIKVVVDDSLGMLRKEAFCAHCDSHLGHVFDDGPK